MDALLQSLTYLLPTGYAWPRDPDSVLMRTVRGIAASLAELHDFSVQTVWQWQPHLVSPRLAEWEDAAGLPDGCFGVTQTIPRRRDVLLARLRGPQGAYSDSSPASPGGLEALCTTLGFNATVRYNTPFRCGRNRCGERLGTLDGKLYVLVSTQSEPLRVGVGRVGQRLIHRVLPDAQLECYLRQVVPARYEINVEFI